MNFTDPAALWLLTLLPIALFLAVVRERFSRQAQRCFSLPVSALQPWRSAVRISTVCLALLTLVIALSGLQIRAKVKDELRRHLKLVVGLDVSKSMLAEDVTSSEPNEVANRLNAGRRFALDLFEQLAGEQTGLFFFARNGIEVVAPTRDQGFLRYMVQHTRLAELTESGSDLKEAMLTGSTLLGNGKEQIAGAVILISDGEDTENSMTELTRQSKQLSINNRPVYTIGVGRTKEAYIPIRRPGTTGIDGFYTDSAGRYLQTRLEPNTLKAIAQSSGGRYFTLRETSPQELVDLLPTLITQTTQTQPSLPSTRGFRNWASVLLTIGLVLYAFHCLL